MTPPQAAIRVLLVDDEDRFRRPLLKRLGKRGFQVSETAGGPEALRLLEREPHDVVVLDVKMPGMDGLSALVKIKAAHDETEVILLTGQCSAQDGVAGIKAGAFDYLGKPVEIDHLAEKIRQAFQKIQSAREKARAREYRARMEQRMAAAERLASLGTLAAGVAHEINNPLAVISEAAGWLKGRVRAEDHLPPSLEDSLSLGLEKIENSVKRAKRITHQLLGFARQSESVIREFDLREVVWEVIDLTRKVAGDAGAEVRAAMDQPVFIRSDAGHVRQILINLVTNAVQATGRGGVIEISAENIETGGVVLSVKDNGPGIPPEHLERVFEPFFSTKAPGQGTGLGLSVSRGMIEQLGGRIEVDSRLGFGSVFRVTIPLEPRTKPDGSEPPFNPNYGSTIDD